MSSDFGANARRKMKRPAMVWVVIAIGVAMGAATIAAVLIKNREAKMAEAASWDIQGPPCPTLTQAAFDAGHMTAKKKFRYDQFLFGRVAGHVDCNQVGAEGGTALGAVTLCQFTSAVVLTVTTPKGAYRYQPGFGKAATVIIEKDVPRCVMASNFKLQ